MEVVIRFCNILPHSLHIYPFLYYLRSEFSTDNPILLGHNISGIMLNRKPGFYFLICSQFILTMPSKHFLALQDSPRVYCSYIRSLLADGCCAQYHLDVESNFMNKAFLDNLTLLLQCFTFCTFGYSVFLGACLFVILLHKLVTPM